MSSVWSGVLIFVGVWLLLAVAIALLFGRVFFPRQPMNSLGGIPTFPAVEGDGPRPGSSLYPLPWARTQDVAPTDRGARQ